jgi:hypothetical protein
MSTDPHRVTAQHIHGLAAADKMRAGGTLLVDTDDGLRFVAPGAVFAPALSVRRILLTHTDLVEDAGNAGLTLSAFLKAHAGRIAAELNQLDD